MAVSSPVAPAHYPRAFGLKTLALDLMDRAGEWEAVEGYPGKVRSFHGGALFMLHRTPFQAVPISSAATLAGIAPGTQRDLAREYGLDVWRENRKVMSLIWNEGGALGIVMFKEGEWEQELIGLAQKGRAKLG